MKEINCDICGKLVAVLAVGSRIQTGAVMFCRGCSRDTFDDDVVCEKTARFPPGKSCDVVDDLAKMFGMKKQQ